MKEKRRDVLRGCLLGVLLFLGGGTLLVVTSWPEIALDAVGSIPSSRGVFDDGGRLLRLWPDETGAWSLPVSLDAMGEWLPKIAVAVEDRRFFSHGGVDLRALLRAVVQNLQAREIRSGGSTITSQLVRLTFPRPRTWRTKADEFRQAVTVEQHFSKEEILELYLNKAFFGGMLRGVEAASLGWFGKACKDLSPGEAAFLVALLKGPTAYRPDRHYARSKARRDSLLGILREQGLLSEEMYERSCKEPLPLSMKSFPLAAPLASEYLYRKYPEKKRMEATINRDVQEEFQRLCTRYLKPFSSHVTMAGLVMENATGKVKACVGNARWGEGTPGSWIDCSRVFRSPGSALKSFVYAAAFDRGYLTPDFLLADTPYGFGGRNPRNYDRIFRGPVSVREALSLSLNVPAVRVLRMVRGNAFLGLLRRLGFSAFREDSSYYGDALVLGGCEVSLEEIVRAYGVFSRGGDLPLLCWDTEDVSRSLSLPEEKIFSPGAAFLTTLCLARRERLPAATRLFLGEQNIEIALKTGTSYGMRDAWTVAFTPNYTVGIWVGDPAGSPLQDVSGIRAAAPGAVAMLLALEKGKGGAVFPVPGDVSRREICVLSGRPPGEACPATSMGWYIPGVSSGKACALHRKEGNKTVIHWPKALEGYERGALPRETPGKITIVSPREGIRIVVPPGREEKMPCRAEGGKRPFYWYVDGVYVGAQEGEEPCFWLLEPGKHHIAVTDREGNTSSCFFEVAHTLGAPEYR